MNTVDYFFIAFLAFLIVISIRNQMVFKFRIRALDSDFDAYRRGNSYHKMIFQFDKWTFKQFYPEIAAKGK